MQVAHLDFETYSAAPLKVTGAYRYAQDFTTEVLIASYWLPGMAHGDDPLVWLPYKEPIPAELRVAAASKDVIWYAHNAQFERSVWHYALRRRWPRLADIPPERWRCTAAMARASGLSGRLEVAMRMLGTGVEKDAEGSRLIKKFSVPRKPTKADPRTRIHPDDDPADFQRFVEYCQQDVRAEMELHDKLPDLHPREQKFFTLDMVMNERGLPIDVPLARKASRVLAVLEQDIATEVTKLTGGIRATQREKLMAFLQTQGLSMENLQAQTVRDALKNLQDLPPNLQRLLLLRIEASKASTKKIKSMLACACPETGVVRGGFLFHGAHTGRYAGRLVQPQNFIRGNLKPHQQDRVFRLLDMDDPDVLKLVYEWPIDTVSQVMRGFIAAPNGKKFVVVDYTAIEARVLAWVAGELRVLRAYRQGVDVYKMMASALFGVPIEEVTSEQRRLGKNLVLGCGYSLGAARFVEYCAGLGTHVEPDFARVAVKLYREQHPAIVASWKVAEQAAVDAILNPGQKFKALRCTFFVRDEWLCIRLPSGREIRYFRPKALPVERWGKAAYQISFVTEYNGKIYRDTTYGGKLVENIVQAIARDVMREGMFQAEDAGYPCVGTVHDELLTLPDEDFGSHEELEAVVCEPADWMQGIPLGSEGFTTRRYRKG